MTPSRRSGAAGSPDRFALAGAARSLFADLNEGQREPGGYGAQAGPSVSVPEEAPVDRWNAGDEGYVRANDGTRLYCCVRGSGPEWLLVPGIGADFDFDRLADGRSVVFFDIRNRGRSDAVPSSGEVGFPIEVDDLETVREQFGMARVSVLAWSYVGVVAALYAARYPVAVERLVMSCPTPARHYPPAVETEADARALRQLSDLHEKGLDQSDPAEFARQWRRIAARSRMGDPLAVDGLRVDPGLWRNEWPSNMLEAMDRVRSTMPADFDYRSEAERIAAPTLIIGGEVDAIPIEATREWAAVIPAARLVTIPNVGHFPHVEVPDHYFRIVGDFLRAE